MADSATDLNRPLAMDEAISSAGHISPPSSKRRFISSQFTTKVTENQEGIATDTESVVDDLDNLTDAAGLQQQQLKEEYDFWLGKLAELVAAGKRYDKIRQETLGLRLKEKLGRQEPKITRQNILFLQNQCKQLENAATSLNNKSRKIVCENVYALKCDMIRHEKQHDDSIDYITCPICDAYRSKRKDKVDNHMKILMPNADKTFAYQKTMKVHFTTKHTE